MGAGARYSEYAVVSAHTHARLVGKVGVADDAREMPERGTSSLQQETNAAFLTGAEALSFTAARARKKHDAIRQRWHETCWEVSRKVPGHKSWLSQVL